MRMTSRSVWAGRRAALAAGALAAFVSMGMASAQAAQNPAWPQNRGPVFAEPAKAAAAMEAEDIGARAFIAPVAEGTTGFVPLFDGKSLDGWAGAPGLWRVENGVIVGETTAAKPLEVNSFLMWKGDPVQNFELEVEIKIVGYEANSGIVYRAWEALPFRLVGFQADMDNVGLYSGNLHLEGGRIICPPSPCQVAPHGQFTRADETGAIRLVGTVSQPSTLKGLINPGSWNTYRLIVRDRVHLLLLNGQLSSVFISDDPRLQLTDNGKLGIQLHVGPPMKVMVRRIGLKRL